ncbi:hypothetical protein GCM10028803_41460 [Larkinella knui]|uniref:Uncharacterized protein n=1 Tax=Larkinella knui TaxID=2025310 RepID=A0A3P1CN78_9BACT|nr:hypothetical protein [Larkinella knui]RRB14777.1 hypothetical protein EHT87_09410 [Larkinella knui]
MRTPEDDHTPGAFRTLFSEDETREFYRPEIQLPTRRIAFWSIGASCLLAGALVMSRLQGQNRPVMPLKPVRHLLKIQL